MRLQGVMAMTWLAALAACGTTDGSNIAEDIKRDFYENTPLVGATLTPDSKVPFSVLRKASGSNPKGLGAGIASSDVPWQVPAACRAQFRTWVKQQVQRGPVIDQATYDTFFNTHPGCQRNNNLVGVAISGGGPKSAIFATEVLFELQRYGLAEEIDVISSVSGGSYAAALYAYSCDGAACPKVENSTRPAWHYETISKTVGTNRFILDFGVTAAIRSPLAWIGTGSNTSDTYAAVLAGTYGIPLDATFAELNPARPNLILNATNDTRSRIDFDANSDIPKSNHRPLSFDDALHFSFTEQYFWRLLSDLSDYKVNFAVAASGAFPAVVDRVGLRHYRAEELRRMAGATGGAELERQDPRYVSLLDGGVNDNFGVLELGWIVECNFGLLTPNGGFLDRQALAGMSATAPNSPTVIYRRRCGRDLPPATAQAPGSVLILGINSSQNRSGGRTDKQPKPVDPFDRMLPYVKPVGTFDAVTQIMNTSGERRREGMGNLIDTIHLRQVGAQKKSTYLPAAAGQMRYVDIDIDAVQVLYCEDDLKNDATILNRVTASSHKERCESLKRVLEWQRDRDLDLPTIDPSFCEKGPPCADLARFVGSEVAEQMEKPVAKEDPVAKRKRDWLEVPIPNDIILQADKRPFNNRYLFDSVRDVSLLVNDPAQVFALRYIARWAVAHRLADLCRDNPDLFKAMGKYLQVCERPLPHRALGPKGDAIGSTRYHAAVPRQ